MGKQESVMLMGYGRQTEQRRQPRPGRGRRRCLTAGKLIESPRGGIETSEAEGCSDMDKAQSRQWRAAIEALNTRTRGGARELEMVTRVPKHDRKKEAKVRPTRAGRVFEAQKGGGLMLASRASEGSACKQRVRRWHRAR